MIHVADAVRDGFKKISITTVDTDVIVIAISEFKDTEAEEIWLAFATEKHFHYIPIHDIEQSLVLFNLGFYQYSKPLQVATLYLHLQDEERKQHGYMECFPPRYQLLFVQMTDQPSTICRDSILPLLERYVVLLYHRTSESNSVNEARKVLFA
ncbi:unnamed protein product [Mytilus coruscus]|uniref:Uncharacterized protein n=1 Tax=Mytilus coruscus TaxID=42192 RepID=A0A6J8C413_MYTCO|nr:unnamed protein product [Mytilus coruscus]